MSTYQPVARPAQEQANPRRPKRGSYKPEPETVALLKVSGNPINGLGDTTLRRPSPTRPTTLALRPRTRGAKARRAFAGSTRKSVGVECRDWIEAHGAQRRDIAGGECDRGQYKGDAGEGG
jgi:hypothetical protein